MLCLIAPSSRGTLLGGDLYVHSIAASNLPGQVPFNLSFKRDTTRSLIGQTPYHARVRTATTSNLSLETRTHLEHHHRPILYRTSWILATGEELPDQQGSKVMPQLSVRLPLRAQTMYDEGLMLE